MSQITIAAIFETKPSQNRESLPNQESSVYDIISFQFIKGSSVELQNECTRQVGGHSCGLVCPQDIWKLKL